jgi:hypothetical protein
MKGPGVESIPGIPELDTLARDYALKRDARMEKTKPEVEAKDALILAVKDKVKDGTLPADPKTRIVTYKHEDVSIILRPSKDKLRVRIGEEEGEEVETE